MNAFNPEETAQVLTAFLADAFSSAGFSKAIIALSGGVDSSTSAALVVRALGKGNVFPVLLPYGNLTTQGTNDARHVIDFLEIPQENIIEVDIAPFVDPLLAFNQSMDKVRKGNVMARTRMIVLFDKAKANNALVVGTENKSEHLLGYFTRFGDEASDIEPLRNLYKTQVYQLAKYLGVPEPILTKKPTAGLWEGQTDEGEFGFTYKDADEILSLLYDEKKSIDEAIASGYNQKVVEKVRLRISANSYKHYLPILPNNP